MTVASPHQHPLSVEVPSSLGLIVSFTLAGLALGVTDGIETILGGFGSGLNAIDISIVVVSSGFAVALVGTLTGLLVCGGILTLRLAGFVFDQRGGIQFPSRKRMSPKAITGVFIGATLGSLGGLCAFYSLLLFGSGRSLVGTTTLVASSAGVTSIALGWLLSRDRCPRALHCGLWVLAVIAFYILETRLVYKFSRLGTLTVAAHAVLIPLLVLLFGSGIWFGTRPLRRSVAAHRRAYAAALVVSVVGVAVTLLAVECFGHHRVRLVLHGRTTLAFRPLSLVPACAPWRAASQRDSWRRSCTESSRPTMGKGSKPSAPNLRPELRGVVLIIVDSLRSDRITAHRAGQVLMPSLQRLGLRSLTFPNVYTTAPGTTRALASMLTSRFAGEVDRSTLEGLSLPSTLAAAGVRSIAVSGHEHLRNLTRMFDEYDDRAAAHRFPDYKNALTSQHTVAAARSWLERIADERFFLLVHFFDPHAHYVTNSLFDFGRSEEARYDAEVAHTDHWIGVLLSTLEYHEDIGVLVTSDHGDEFWEHRYKRHQLRLYDETTRVPLLIADPRSPEANVNTLDTSLIDIAPTVLQMLSVPRPPSMRGRALIGSLTKSRARTGIPIHVQSTNDRKRAVVINRRKLIFDSQTAIVEYYDLKIDPAETRNLADRNSLKQRQLECALETWMQTQNL